MVVCKFFLQGNCRYGDNCRYDHPRTGGSTFGSNNRFGALQNTDNRLNGGQGSTPATGWPRLPSGIAGEDAPFESSWPTMFALPSDPMIGVRYELTVVLFQGASKSSSSSQWSIEATQVEQIRQELGKERPKWVLTSYGAVKNTPGSLFEGNEYSAEEIRHRFYEMAAKGQEAQANQEASQLWSKAETDMNNALNHVNDVRKFMEDCEKKHPNRYDFLNFDGTKSREDHAKAVETSQSSASSSAFGAGSGFGQPSAAASNPFSKPAAATFGQPSGPSAFGGNAFGKPAQPSAFGQGGFGAPASTNAFAQPTAASAFGSKPAFGSSGFGQSGFGQAAQPAQTTSPFGQPAQPSAFGTSGFGSGSGSSTSAFGKPAQPASAFGQPSQPTSTFGQPSQPTSGFGQPAFGQAGFGQSAFGQPSKPTSGFGQSGFGQTAQPSTTSGFGTASSSGFGMTAQPTSNPFGAKDPSTSTPEISMDSDAPAVVQASQPATTSPFGATSAPANTFGAPSVGTQQQSSQVAAAATNVNNSQTPHPLTGNPPAPLVYAQTLPAGPTQMTMTKQLSTYRGQAVRYIADTSSVTPEGTSIPCYNRPDGKGAEKIWFPDGAAAPEIVFLNREEKIGDIQAPAEKYTDAVKNAYKALFDTGRFEPGKMPLVPPMREWTAYDF